MGWTETYYDMKLTQKERREELDKLFSWSNDDRDYEVKKSVITNNEYYAAVAQTDKNTGEVEVWGVVCLLSQRKEGFGYWYGYKDMSEDCGPYCYNCPEKILDLLTPTDNEWANTWREKCREKARKPKLQAMKAGASIRFVCPWPTTYHKEGDEVVLTKTVVCKTKNWRTGRTRTTYRWLEPCGCIYWKQTMIPDDFEVVA